MREATIILLYAVALAQGKFLILQHAQHCDCSKVQDTCKDISGSDHDVILAHKYCDMFYKCSNGKAYAMKCASNLLYDSVKEICEWPDLVACGNRLISQSGRNNSGSNDCDCTNEDGLASIQIPVLSVNDNKLRNTATYNCNPNEAPMICSGANSDSILIAHEKCNKFYICAHGKPVALQCPSNTLYNPYEEKCDWYGNVECGGRVIPDLEDDNDDNNNDNDSDNDDNNSSCNCNPEEAPSICARVDSDSTLIAHKKCNKFYICANGKPVAIECPPNTLYDPYKERCDWDSNVDCGDRVITDPEDDSDCNDSNDNDDNNNDSSSNENENGGANDTCNCNPGEAPSICAREDSHGVLIAHEKCNKFYMCAHGKPVALKCPPNTLYDPYEEQCEWASNVECGDRVIPDPEDDNDSDNGNDDNNNDNNDNNGNDNGGNNNNSTCNCNPGEATSICARADSDDVLIAHEMCNKFYMCTNGKPVALECPPNTLYDPHKEQCDWASNVECVDRVIPNPDDDNDDNDSDNDNNDSNNDNNDSNGNDNGGGNNNSTCNCNPGEAPSICARANSDSILIAHENCNKFYICAHGQPVALKCPSRTLYNPYKQQCDWASNVDCGDRVIPDPEDDNNNDNNDNIGNDNGSNNNNSTCNCNPGEARSICARVDSDSVLVAHEKCKKFYICTNGKPVALECPPNTLYNPYEEQCDWPSNVECGDRVISDLDEENNNNGSDNENDDNNGNNNDSTCNCNPEEAPAICSRADSEGDLVAHEKCDKFYKCAYGKPVEFQCPKATLYDPFTEVCDMETEVVCNGRS